MKKIALLATVALISISAFAQRAEGGKFEENNRRDGRYRDNRQGPGREHIRRRAGKCPPVYIGFSGGVNNPSGFIGFDVDVPVAPHISISGGVGASTWGTKLHIDGKYYLLPCNRGWAFGGGLTYNTGLSDFSTTITTNGNTEDVEIKMDPQVNIFIAAYYYFNMGRAYNRFYLEAGLSAPLVSNKYDNLSYSPISSDADKVIRILAPGGLMLGAGFSFGVRGR